MEIAYSAGIRVSLPSVFVFSITHATALSAMRLHWPSSVPRLFLVEFAAWFVVSAFTTTV